LSNDPFEWHGVSYVSPSTLNAMRDDLAYGLMRVIPSLRVREPMGPAAPRGTALDKALTAAAYRPDADDDTILAHAHRVFADECERNDLDPEAADVTKERDAIAGYIKSALPEVRRWGPPVADQGKVELRCEGIEVPLIGYYDLKYPDRQRELKTTNRMPSAVSIRHARQASVYAAALKSQVWVSYITPREIRSYPVQDVDAHLTDVAGQLHALRRLLSVSRDTREVIALVSPNYEAWCWSDKTKAAARDLWGY